MLTAQQKMASASRALTAQCYRGGVPELSTASVRAASDRRFYLFNALLSIVALSFLTYILAIRHGSGGSASQLNFLPAVNASLNATAAVLLCAGYVAIRKKARRLHQYLMVSAFGASSLFRLAGHLRQTSENCAGDAAPLALRLGDRGGDLLHAPRRHRRSSLKIGNRFFERLHRVVGKQDEEDSLDR